MNLLDLTKYINQKRKEREMKLTQEQVLEMEILHNVYIDVGSMTFTHGKRDDIYGWRPIPAEWQPNNEQRQKKN